MNTALGLVVTVAFMALALWHFYMALWPTGSIDGAIPSESGKPLFLPSTKATLAVGFVLLVFAALVAATSGLIEVAIPGHVLAWLSYVLALGLLARAVGEFKYVGFFKRVRGSRFARLDTFLYSPLCLLLAMGVALVAKRHGI